MGAYDAVKAISEGRLGVSFCIGLGAIAAFYLTIKSFNPLTIVMLGVCWTGLVLNISRGPVLFGIVASVLYLLFVMRYRVVNFSRNKKFLMVIMLMGMVPVVASQLFSVDFIANRFAKLFDTTGGEQTAGRGDVWADSIEKIGQSPIVGHGLGSYFTDGITPHNVILQFGEDSGLVGIILMLVFFICGAKYLFRSMQLSNQASINMVLATGAFFLFTLLNFQKSNDAYINRELYILTALPFAIHAEMIIRAVRRRRRASSIRRRRSSRRRRLHKAKESLANG